MARYTGPVTKKSRAFGQSLIGYDKSFERKKYPPGQHGPSRKKKQKSDYAVQLVEKQKAKYTYGVLERQFRNIFHDAHKKGGVTGENLLQYLEARLDNTVYRLGISATRKGSRQLVSHRHITVNGRVVNIPSYRLLPGDVIAVRGKSQSMDHIHHQVAQKSDVRKFPWVEWNADKMEGKFLQYPSRDQIPEVINEQLIVELYSK
ncbi:MAG: 30S ribosomal protein S4 [Saprospiraceae bacterium]|jgi:small subunit ribosomal protein S4|nr:30S ribosomal protein S4 [Saprospiraceae bacterium]MBK7797110.1 30S ribosomal protein S4 [Saprospiraceae bacterium]MBL0259500.1 30S ribosomal protein S4 [Saprospiraceae bacterium]MBX7163427.1 30S ribosomal protein S4 [Saprospiraceae bacterium]